MLILPMIFTGSSQLMMIIPSLQNFHFMMILPLIITGIPADDHPSFDPHRNSS